MSVVFAGLSVRPGMRLPSPFKPLPSPSASLRIVVIRFASADGPGRLPVFFDLSFSVRAAAAGIILVFPFRYVVPIDDSFLEG